MLPNVSKLSLNDDKKCVPCMTPVRFRNRDEQLQDHIAGFVFRETLEDQIKAADCEICMEPMATNASGAPVRAAAAQSTPFYVDYCGNGHYFHKWCAHGLLEREAWLARWHGELGHRRAVVSHPYSLCDGGRLTAAA